MQCQVCGNLTANDGKCTQCGFGDNGVLFLKEDQARYWLTNQVLPLRKEWRLQEAEEETQQRLDKPKEEIPEKEQQLQAWRINEIKRRHEIRTVRFVDEEGKKYCIIENPQAFCPVMEKTKIKPWKKFPLFKVGIKILLCVILFSSPIAIYDWLTFATEEDGYTAGATVDGISLNRDEITIDPGDEGFFILRVTPSNAPNENVRWSSSNTGVAKIIRDSSSGVSVIGISPGTATITATTEDGRHTARGTVVVSKHLADIPKVKLTEPERYYDLITNLQSVTVMEKNKDQAAANIPFIYMPSIKKRRATVFTFGERLQQLSLEGNDRRS